MSVNPGDALSNDFADSGVLTFCSLSDGSSRKLEYPPTQSVHLPIFCASWALHIVEQTVPVASTFRASGAVVSLQESIPHLDSAATRGSERL